MLGDRLRQLRKQRRMNQTALAAAAGIDQRYLSDLERGHRTNPSREVIAALARALDVPVLDLAEAAWEGTLPPPGETLPIPDDVAATLRKVGPQLSDREWQRVVGYLQSLAEERAPYTPAAPPDDESEGQSSP